MLFSAVDNELIVIRSEGQHLAAGEKRDNTKQDHFSYVVMGERA